MVNSAHETNVIRHHDLQKMWKQFASITKRLKQTSAKNETEDAIAKDLKLTSEGRALLAGEFLLRNSHRDALRASLAKHEWYNPDI